MSPKSLYLAKFIFIFIILVTVICFLFQKHIAIHFNSENPTRILLTVIYSSISEFIINISIILIPIALWISRFVEVFKNDKKDLFSLKQYLIYIRHEMAGHIKSDTKLKDAPQIIKQIDSLLRKFNFIKKADILYYNISDESLIHIDDTIIAVIKKTLKYDWGKFYNSLQRELKSFTDEFRGILKDYPKFQLSQRLKENFSNKFKRQIGYVLGYELFLEEKFKSGEATLYYMN